MRLIDADALKEKAFFHEIDNVSYVEEEDVDKAPTVDAVSVVLCKDCKYLRKWYKSEMYECARMQVLTGLNEFCSRGEKNENNREKDTAELLQSGRTKCKIV